MDTEIKVKYNNEEYVNTNLGKIPVKDYLDMRAAQNGFENYEEMKAAGYYIGAYR